MSTNIENLISKKENLISKKLKIFSWFLIYPVLIIFLHLNEMSQQT